MAKTVKPNTPSTPAEIETTSLSGNNTIDGLLWGTHLEPWNGANGPSISYSFASDETYFSTSGNTAYSRYTSEPWFNIRALNQNEAETFSQILLSFSSVIDLNFPNTLETNNSVGNIRIAWTDYERPANSAWAYLPANTASSSDIWLNSSILNPNRSDLFFQSLLIHEVGHAIGLKHPDEAGKSGTYLPEEYNSVEYTVMSYNPSASAANAVATDLWPQSLMWLDIQALQHLYGANDISSAGDNTYHFQTSNRYYETIWDSSGTDTLSFSGPANLRINMNAGEWSHVGTEIHYWDKNGRLLDKVKSQTLFLTPDTQIENILSNAGHDHILGNQWSNKVTSGAGNDTVRGAEGNDRISGNDGHDLIFGDSGHDTLTGGSGNDKIYSGPTDQENDHIAGGAGNDELGGGPGDDLIIGDGISGPSPFNGASISASGSGNDTLFGGSGNDTLVGGGWHNKGGTNNHFDIGEQTSSGSEANHLWASSGNDLLIGGDGEDQLGGCMGDDTIIAGDGDDILWGGHGDDKLTGGDGSDVFVFGENHGMDQINDFNLKEDTLDFSEPSLDLTNTTALRETATEKNIDGSPVLILHTGGKNTLALVGLTIEDIPFLDIAFSLPTG